MVALEVHAQPSPGRRPRRQDECLEGEGRPLARGLLFQGREGKGPGALRRALDQRGVVEAASLIGHGDREFLAVEQEDEVNVFLGIAVVAVACGIFDGLGHRGAHRAEVLAVQACFLEQVGGQFVGPGDVFRMGAKLQVGLVEDDLSVLGDALEFGLAEREELHHLERLDQVVVLPDFELAPRIDVGAAPVEFDHRHDAPPLLGLDRPEEVLRAVHRVLEDDQVGVHLVEPAEGLLAVGDYLEAAVGSEEPHARDVGEAVLLGGD